MRWEQNPQRPIYITCLPVPDMVFKHYFALFSDSTMIDAEIGCRQLCFIDAIRSVSVAAGERFALRWIRYSLRTGHCLQRIAGHPRIR